MRKSITIVYNQLLPSRHEKTYDGKAVLGVLLCVTAVNRALIELGHYVTVIALSPPYEQVRNILTSLDTDLVFNLFEGFPDEPQTEAIVPEILTEVGIAFTGCPAPVLRLALDKAGAKKLLIAEGIPTPDFQVLNPRKMNIFRLKYPCIVKPLGEDASNGITAESVVNDFASLEKRVKAVSDLYDGQALVEEYIGGREFNVTVIGNTRYNVLPASEIVYSLPLEMPALLTFEAKWEPDSVYYQETNVVCPADITHKEQISVYEMALASCHLLGCSGYARVDMRLDEKQNLNVIEVNPNPDISPEAGAARQAAAAGMSYTKFIDTIVRLALEKKRYGRKDSRHECRRQASAGAYSKTHA
jgi:D-alanine-D-alanine ligase